MIATFALVWLALNYAFAATLVFVCARRKCASRLAALREAALWPRALAGVPSPIF